MSDDAAFYVWSAVALCVVLCAAELASLALRLRNIRAHLGWRPHDPEP